MSEIRDSIIVFGDRLMVCAVVIDEFLQFYKAGVTTRSKITQPKTQSDSLKISKCHW